MWQVEHAVVIRATTRSTCNAAVLRHKLNENVAGISWPLPTCDHVFIESLLSNSHRTVKWSLKIKYRINNQSGLIQTCGIELLLLFSDQ